MIPKFAIIMILGVLISDFCGTPFTAVIWDKGQCLQEPGKYLDWSMMSFTLVYLDNSKFETER